MKRAIPLFLFLVSSAAWAQFYAGGGIGRSKMHDACAQLPAGESCKDTGTAWKAFLGYQFHRNFAAEAAYVDLGKATASGLFSAEGKSNGFDVAAVGIAPIADRVSLFGKIGIYRLDTKISGSVTGLSITESQSNSDLTFGGGAQLALTQALAVRGEWQRYSRVGGDNVGGKSDIDILGVSALYRF